MAVSRQRVDALRTEAVRTAKSVKGIIALFAGALIPFFARLLDWFPRVHPVVLAVFVLCGMLLAFALLLAWNLTRYADDREWFGRKYRLISQRWSYTLNHDSKTLHAVCVGERHVVCTRDTITHLTIPVSPAENLVPFDPNDEYVIELDPQSRYSRGEISVRKPHRKEGSNFSFRIDFSPPLEVDDEAYVKFRFSLPKFKIAMLEYVRERQQIAALDACDYQLSWFNINYPTERFIFELRFASECKIKPRSPEALRGETPLRSEQEELRKPGVYLARQEDDGTWLLRLDRKNPPVKTKYRLSWYPPREADLTTGTFEH